MPDAAPLPPFLGCDNPGAERACVGILPFGYEGTVSYGRGTAEGPRAILEASAQVELYDEALGYEPCQAGIVTLPQPPLPRTPADAVAAARDGTSRLLARGLWPVVLGGEHSISSGVCEALTEAYDELGVIQFDAHADLRASYGGSPHSHACVMARMRERIGAVLQLGIRSLSAAEAERIRASGYAVGWMREMRSGAFDLASALAALPDRVFLTFDVDALDLNLVRATGTPEPGGFTWGEVTHTLAEIFQTKTVVGMDMVELCGGDRISAFCVARLVYRMIGLRFPPSEGFARPASG